jgi:hypothetical protein
MLMFHVQSPEQLGTKPNCLSSDALVRRRSSRGGQPPVEIDVRRSLTMQRPCHVRARRALVSAVMLLGVIAPVCSAPPVHDYPTHVRVEYVNECAAKHGGKLSQVYQCSCVIDDIANTLSYDDFVEASTFAKYSSLPREGGGIFRDSEQAQSKAKLYRELEKRAYRECGLES